MLNPGIIEASLEILCILNNSDKKAATLLKPREKNFWKLNVLLRSTLHLGKSQKLREF